MLRPLSTQIVGSYAKPHWLGRHERIHHLDGSWWRPEADVLEEAKQDAALLAIYEQESAGLDIVTDGEAQRVAYDRHFLASLSGIDMMDTEKQAYVSEVETRKRNAEVAEMMEHFQLNPKIVGPIEWVRSSAAKDLEFLVAHARRPVKVNVVGPLTLLDRLADHYYGNPRDAAMALAGAINKEMLALEKLGPAVIQIDEPAFHFKLSRAREFGVDLLTKLVEGLSAPVIVHACYGYSLYAESKTANPTYHEVAEIIAASPVQGMSLEYEQPWHGPDLLKHTGDKHVLIGLVNLGSREIETAEHVATRLRAALEVVPAERLHPCTDCGMWFLPRAVAYGKIRALVEGTKMVKDQLK